MTKSLQELKSRVYDLHEEIGKINKNIQELVKPLQEKAKPLVEERNKLNIEIKAREQAQGAGITTINDERNK